MFFSSLLAFKLLFLGQSLATNFENLTNKLYVFYALNKHVKFCVNRILFII